MKSITWKIFFPIILVLILVFSLLVIMVTRSVAGGIITQFDDNSKVQVDSIYQTVSSLYSFEQERQKELMQQSRASLEQETNIAVDMVSWFYSRYRQGYLSNDEAKTQALAALTSLSFGEEGYFFILDDQYTMLAHPSETIETGVSWENVEDSKGTLYVKDMIDLAVSTGSGFIEYEFPKLGAEEASPKLGYMEYFEPWGWAIGTGLYLDFIEESSKRMHEETIEQLNKVLYVDTEDSAQSYPFIKSRDDIYIAYIDQNKVGNRSSSQDKKTGEDLTSVYFEKGEGSLVYHFTRSGEDKVYKKLAYVRVFEEWDWVIVYSVYEDLILKGVKNIVLILIFSGMVTIVICGGVILAILLIIVKKVKNAAHGFEEFATGSGDLTHRLKGEGEDEVGQLVGSFNKFITKLQGIILELQSISSKSREIGNSLNDDSSNISVSLEQIVSNVGSIESSSEKLNNHSELTVNALNDIFNAVEVVNNQIVEEAASVEESSASIEEMIASVNNISRISNERKNEVDSLTVMASDSSRQMEATMADITKISTSVDSIRDVISVINGISSQINLLAMNAAIEAAHAGDAGRGFAVVADEVRKLAESTSKNSKQISESIQSIIVDINQTQEKSQETGEIIVRMEAGSRSVSQMISEVIAAISEVSSGNQQILEALSNLKESSLAVKESSALVEDKTQFAVHTVEEIAGLSRQNYQGVKEIRGALGEISESVNHISSLGADNSENLVRINDQVGNFKVHED